MKRRWKLYNADGSLVGEYGLLDWPTIRLVVWINNKVAGSDKWGERFKVRLERVR